jgi:hypothetical protein
VGIVPEPAVSPQTSETEPRLSIGQVAEHTGLSVHALRFYEREGLLVTPVQRGSDGHRAYSEWDLDTPAVPPRA